MSEKNGKGGPLDLAYPTLVGHRPINLRTVPLPGS